MDAFLQQFQHLKIELQEITSASDSFNDEKNCIGGGGFGKVYKGEMSHSEGRSLVAIKRLDPRYGQGIPEFLKEITALSRYRHENLISLLGFCYEEHEMILVYEHASRGSLDRHLKSPHLTWSQRLKICLDAAKGLSYLHDPRETHQRLIHCDIKSANILLDDQWNAKVSDFGLSIMGSANEQQSVIVTVAAGTPGYCDPQYAMTNTLTKESDVYSFGVVLFEVLCGAVCCTYNNGRVQQKLVPMWIESYKQKKLNDIIFKNQTIQPLDQSALETFSDIAYRCLKGSREDRPKMAEVVTELETALKSQELSEWIPPFDYDEITKTAEPTLNYKTNGELRRLLSEGVLLNSGKTWFSLNKKGEQCEMISFAECLDSEFESNPWSSEYISRFAKGTYPHKDASVIAHVKARFLSPGITYTVNLVFKFIVPIDVRKCEHISLRYKLLDETETSISYLAYEREDGWWMCELYQLTCDHRVVDLEILFKGFHYSNTSIAAEGIEFRPLEKEDEKLDMQPILDSDSNWEEKLPNNYEDIMKWSKNSMQWTTKKEAYSILRKGFLTNDGQEWFFLDKNGKKCVMLSSRGACTPSRYEYQHHRLKYQHWLSSPESRFGEAAEFKLRTVAISGHIQSQLVSSHTTYATYLVYKLPENQSVYEEPVEVTVNDGDIFTDNCWYTYLVSPQTPVIKPKAGQSTHNPVNMPKTKGLPQQRNDGWMEVQIWEFHTAATTKKIPIGLMLTFCGVHSNDPIPGGFLIQGVEFRPI